MTTPPPSNSESTAAPTGEKTRQSLWGAVTSAINGAWRRVQPWLPYNVAAPPAILVLVLALSCTHLFIGFEARTLDARYQFRAKQDPEFDLRLIAGNIEERTLNALQSWPIPRRFYAELLEVLINRNNLEVSERPRVLAFDLILDRLGGIPEDDTNLVNIAPEYPGFITGAASDQRSVSFVALYGSDAALSISDPTRKRIVDEMYIFGQTFNIPKVTGDISNISGSDYAIFPHRALREVSKFGFVDSDPGIADPARRLLPMVARVGNKVFASFVLQILAEYWDVASDKIEVELGREIRMTEGSDSSNKPGALHRIPINDKGELYINYRQRRQRDNAPVDTPLIMIWSAAKSLFNGTDSSVFADAYKQKLMRPLRGNILIVGLTAVGTSDLGVTPFSSKEPLVYIHLNALNTILRQDYVRTIPLMLECLIWLAVSSAVLYLLDRCALRVAITVPFLIVGSYLVLTLVIFASHSLILPIVWPVLGFSTVCVGSAYLRWQAEQLEKQRISKIFSSYVSPGIMEEVMSDPNKVKLGGASKRVTIMFSDIRGFTTFSEAMGDEALVIQLNEYFDKMVGCVIKYDGTLHKFIGDAIMAVWGDVVSKSEAEDARNAVRCALAMRKALVELNAFWKKSNRMTQAFGIGINHGMVRVGNIGAPTRMEFTVIGDPVNFASRLEGVTKEFRTDFLIGESVKPLLGDDFLLRTAGKILVKGKTEAITVYEVVCVVTDPDYLRQKDWVAVYETAFAAYQARRFSEALVGFQACLAHPGREHDFCCEQYAEACQDFIAEPPLNWTGVYVMKTK